MAHELLWIYLFNLIVNSSLAFFTIALLISLVFKVVRISNLRLKALLLCIPLCKIVTDLFFYNFSNWALLHNENPLLAEQDTRTLSIMLNPLAVIEMTMQDGKTFTLADALALSIPLVWVQAAVLIAAAGSLFFLSVFLIRLIQEKRQLTAIILRATPLSLSVQPDLVSWMRKKKIQVYATHEMEVPAISGKAIFLPLKMLRGFTREELEAIVAHEIAHEHWRDANVKQASLIIAALFWWIPTGFLRKRIEEAQEMAADKMIRRFNIPPLALAEALLKTAQGAKEEPSPLIIHFTSSLKKRMECLLQATSKPHPLLETGRYGLLIVLITLIAFGRFWLF